MTAGQIASLTVWPVKSMGGGTPVTSVGVDAYGLAGDRRHALVDRRPLRDGTVVSARSLPGVLRWSAGWPATAGDDAVTTEPVLTGPDGGTWRWSDPALPAALTADLGAAVEPRTGGGPFADLADSVLVTTRASHAAVEQAFGRPLDPRRWRTNVELALDLPAFAEEGWQGGRIVVGDAVLRLLHPCRRCTIPTWEPGGRQRNPELLRWLLTEHTGCFGINARVEVPGVLDVGAPVTVELPTSASRATQ